MDLNLTGKVALITGASRGLGAATARLLAAEGARLALSARSAEMLDATAADILAASGTEVATFAQDLMEPDGADKVAAWAIGEFGHLDILVNSAGAAQGGIFWEIPDQVWEDGLGLKFFANMRMIRAVLPHMRERKYGRIVTIAGGGGVQPQPRALPGGVANAALLALTSGLSREVVRDGIFINAVNPGPILTERWTNRFEAQAAESGRPAQDFQAQVVANIPMGRMGEAVEVARAVAFLASDCASNTTGTSILCDGGEFQGVA
jgi:NAD(P)-dependent dehydrogenase (short-subunit alcohol dehydrogenase family)